MRVKGACSIVGRGRCWQKPGHSHSLSLRDFEAARYATKASTPRPPSRGRRGRHQFLTIALKTAQRKHVYCTIWPRVFVKSSCVSRVRQYSVLYKIVKTVPVSDQNNKIKHETQTVIVIKAKLKKQHTMSHPACAYPYSWGAVNRIY